MSLPLKGHFEVRFTSNGATARFNGEAWESDHEALRMLLNHKLGRMALTHRSVEEVARECLGNIPFSVVSQSQEKWKDDLPTGAID